MDDIFLEAQASDEGNGLLGQLTTYTRRAVARDRRFWSTDAWMVQGTPSPTSGKLFIFNFLCTYLQGSRKWSKV